RQAVAARPEDFVVLEQAARFLLQGDEPRQAQPLLEALLELGSAMPGEHVRRARRQLALVLADKGEEGNRRALALIEENLRDVSKTPADIRARALVRVTDAALGRQAARVFEETAKRQPLSSEELYRLARLFDAAGDLYRARETITQLVALQPE